MSPYKDDRLKDYVEVNERIEKFYERFPDGRLTTYEVRLTSEPDDKPRVQVWDGEHILDWFAKASGLRF